MVATPRRVRRQFADDRVRAESGREVAYETLARIPIGTALFEEVAFRVEGVEREHPYPGLSSFQQEDAEFFFGREAE
ncbi:MAG: hypothetical protein ACERLM_09225, partial [Acidimicrobiales bacterium]